MHLRTRLTLGVATAAAVTGALLTPVAAFAAPVTPNAQLTADPSTPTSNLLDGQTVLLNGSGYNPDSTVYVVECSNLAQGDAASCDGADQSTNIDKVGFAHSDASGNITAFPFKVHTGPTGTTGGKCDATNSACGIAATDSLDPTAAGSHVGALSITFSKIQGAPLTGLHNGDVVTVTGVALQPTTNYAIVECAADADTAGNGCNQAGAVVAQTDANGAFSSPFTVKTGQMDPADPASLCSNTNTGCSLGVAQLDSQFQPVAVAGQLPISFAKPSVATALSAKSTKSQVAKGKRFAIKGQLKAAGAGLNAAKVSLYKITRTGASKLATKTTATNKAGIKGAFKFGGLTQKRTSKYQVKFAGATIAGTTYTASQSKVIKVTT